MKIIKTKNLTETQSEQINQLWNKEYPIELNDRFQNLLEGVENFSHYIIQDNNGNVLAWAVDFEKDNEIRFSVIVSSKQQGKGYGSSLVNQLKKDLKEFYGWVIDHTDYKKANGENYQSPLSFYVKHGFTVLNDLRIDTEILKAVKIKRGS